jgi:WD40 repeat protein
MHLTSGDVIIMGDSKYTELSLPLCSESGSKSSRGKRTAAKLIAGISGLVIFGYFMSATYFSTPESSAINLNAYGAGLIEVVDQYQLDLRSNPVKVSEFGKPNQRHTGLTLSKDNSLAVFLNSQDSIEVWDLQKKELVAQFEQDKSPNILIFTPDSRYLISSYYSSISIWSLATKSLYGKIEEKTNSLLFVSSDSKLLGFETYEGVSVWDIGNLEKSYSLKVPDDSYPGKIAITPDGKYLAMTIFGVVFNTIRVYDMSTRKEIATINETQSYHIRISDDGKIVATAEFSGKTVNVWDLETGKLINKIEHRGYISYFNLSPDGRFVSSADSSRMILYDLKASKKLREIYMSPHESIFTKDSKFLLVPDFYGINVIDLETSREVAALKIDQGVKDLCLSENSEYLLVSTYESVYLWDLTNLYN